MRTDNVVDAELRKAQADRDADRIARTQTLRPIEELRAATMTDDEWFWGRNGRRTH